jgi:hypothetical protein
MAGYHLAEIPRGQYGKVSKIKEEVFELEDAVNQNNKVMALVELSDIILSIEGYLEQEYGNKVTLQDLLIMAKATRRAFDAGHRT